MKPTIVITGGAGYIGSHAALYLAQKKYNVIIIDNFSQNQQFNHNWAQVIKADYADKKVLEEVFSMHNVEAVMHFASFIEVGESVKNPLNFYLNNVAKTFDLIDSMLKHGVNKIIFSSSCAVYGNPKYLPLIEDHPKNPVSPYGRNKLIIENALQDFHDAYGLQFVSLRYFNASGALPEYGLGEQHSPETHLIPLLFKAAKTGKVFTVFGNDYETKDGTCVRDYLHVWDIADAHYKALLHLEENKPSDVFNLGTGNGFSVKQMLEAVERVCQSSIKTIIAPRRSGDPAILVADPSKANNILKWKAKYSDLDFILTSAHAFEHSTRSKIITEKFLDF